MNNADPSGFPGALSRTDMFSTTFSELFPVSPGRNFSPAYNAGFPSPLTMQYQEIYKEERAKVSPPQQSSLPSPVAQQPGSDPQSAVQPITIDAMVPEQSNVSKTPTCQDQELTKAYPIYKRSEEEYDQLNEKEVNKEETKPPKDKNKRTIIEVKVKPATPPKKAGEDTPKCKRCKKFMSTDNERNTFPMGERGYCVYCNKADTVGEEQRQEYIKNSRCYLCGKTYGRSRNTMEHLRDVHREPARRIFPGKWVDDNRLKAWFYAKGVSGVKLVNK